VPKTSINHQNQTAVLVSDSLVLRSCLLNIACEESLYGCLYCTEESNGNAPAVKFPVCTTC